MTRKLFLLICMGAASLSLSACSSTEHPPIHVGAIEINDPWENYNRKVFDFNDAIDEMAVEPVARAYRDITPTPVRKGIHNFLNNLRSPVQVANQLLQGDITGAADSLTRTFANTLFGLGGTIDIAAMTGLPADREDFGQTAAIWGVGDGPYLVAPFYGPASIRDHFGTIVDASADPLANYLTNTDRYHTQLARTGVTLLDKRTELLSILDDLKKNSIDYYASVRSTVYQRRYGLIHDRHKDNGQTDYQEYDEFDDFDDIE